MRLLSPVGLALTIGFLAGHGAGALIQLLPLFAAISFIYLLLALAELTGGAAAPEQRPPTRSRPHASLR